MADLQLRRRELLVLMAAAGIAVGSAAGAASPQGLNTDADGVMLRGYDPVAYFTEGAPVEGSAAFTAEHDGAAYRFASAANRERFVADPVRYVPAYGGYCALGTAMGRKFDGDPQLWRIVEDRLFLNVNAGAQERWLSDTMGFIASADNNWPLISELADADLTASPPAGLIVGAN
jgi:YHS domain-containing protein